MNPLKFANSLRAEWCDHFSSDAVIKGVTAIEVFTFKSNMWASLTIENHYKLVLRMQNFDMILQWEFSGWEMDEWSIRTKEKWKLKCKIGKKLEEYIEIAAMNVVVDLKHLV